MFQAFVHVFSRSFSVCLGAIFLVSFSISCLLLLPLLSYCTFPSHPVYIFSWCFLSPLVSNIVFSFLSLHSCLSAFSECLHSFLLHRVVTISSVLCIVSHYFLPFSPPTVNFFNISSFCFLFLDYVFFFSPISLSFHLPSSSPPPSLPPFFPPRHRPGRYPISMLPIKQTLSLLYCLSRGKNGKLMGIYGTVYDK